MAEAQMSLRGRAFTASTTAPRPSTRCVAVRAASREQQVPLMDRIAPSTLAALVTLSSGLTFADATFAPPARADEEELSPYQKRQLELERRRELLREAREKAAARAAGETPPTPAAPAPAAPVAPSLSDSLSTYKAATQNRPSVPEPAPAPEAPKWGGFNFSRPAAEPETPAEPAPAAKTDAGSSSSSDMGNLFSPDMWNTPIKPKSAEPAAPAPAPAAPAPVTPAPRLFKAPDAPKPKVTPPEPVRKPEPVKKAEVKKPEAAPTKPGKRRGPLPLWFAEVLVLGAYAGLFLAVTKYSKQSGEVLQAVWGKVVAAYSALEKLVNKQQAA